jgi:hypothetical protein
MSRFENIGVFVQEKDGLEPNLSRLITPKFSTTVVLPAYADGTDRVFLNVGI